MYVCHNTHFVCVCVCLYVHVPQRPKEGRSPGSAVMCSCEPPDKELKMAPLEKQKVLLIIEPSLHQPPNPNYNLYEEKKKNKYNEEAGRSLS